ncbi:hypothetical protein I204_01162 [Kwoniella mangroviensis CBS 8886]|uniref:uncharacterized protein n=1 Tax=Kwoniella mangroviensis CBS 8507 TaxID=1296122 RepID=UPI00080CC238|nr:uncharacterized protein I203_08240 [Kwoniella mangroviensis CBS 8507]OCF62665.1 hypothetical protein I203_08240 [Kwoniella mangroviensis CBS 8507]OCF79215.1 hypothetical protein I204_01162 [Kwoniella mangroviensis CBS 8886]
MPIKTPVTAEELSAAAQRLGFTIPPDHEEEYLALLAKTDAQCELILDTPDHKPIPDFENFPRTDVYLPEKKDNPLRAWAWRCHAGSTEKDSSKLLSGKTVVFKDTVCMAGVPLLFGTDAFEDYTPDVDATVVSRVLDCGGHILGKAACENFSHGATSSSSPFGPVENPYAKGFTTGGSSSGCGALVGSGQVDMAIGGDQGGSIRIPASFCGIVGLKPTFGLVPYTGVLTSDAGIDHVGPMTPTVLDCAILLQATAGYDNIDDRQLGAPKYGDIPRYRDLLLAARKSSIGPKKIGVLTEALNGRLVAGSVKRLILRAAQQFRALGMTVDEVSIPMFNLTPALSHIINKLASGGTRQGRQVGRRGLYLNDYWEHLLPWDQYKYDKAKYFVTGTAMSCEYAWLKYPTAYGRAMNLTRQMRDEFDKLFEQYDAIIMPTCPQPPRRHIPAHAGPLGWADHAPGTASITAAFNLTGHPALTIPVGFAFPMPEDILSEDDKGIKLPIGMMIVGKLFDEMGVMVVADALERSVDWKSIVDAE